VVSTLVQPRQERVPFHASLTNDRRFGTPIGAAHGVSGAHVTNRNGAAYHTYNATLPTAAQPGAVGGTREVNAGLRHAF